MSQERPIREADSSTNEADSTVYLSEHVCRALN